MNNTSVDAYLQDGCGRCALYRTPACKVHRWTETLTVLRGIALACGLTEEMKWGSPCYTLGGKPGKNIIMLAAFKDYCALQFFKGAALTDEEGMLESQGPNSHSVRLLKLRSVGEAEAHREIAARLIGQAIALERAGTVVKPAAAPLPEPVELTRRLEADPGLRRAFDALTPGRRRSHILHISGAKQTETRERRVGQCVPAILSGRSFDGR